MKSLINLKKIFIQTSMLTTQNLFYTVQSLPKQVIVRDTFDHPETGKLLEIKCWRDVNMLRENYQGNRLGLDKLCMSGSAVPSYKGFGVILDKIKKISNPTIERIFIVNLRQETHGYINHDAFNLMIPHNLINAGKSNEDILMTEKSWLESLAKQPQIENVLSTKEYKYGFHNNLRGETLTPHSDFPFILDAETSSKQNGFEYMRLFVGDHLSPGSLQVDSFINFVNELPRGCWLHFHCRGGKGRTTTFMAMLDMLHNADRVPFDDIIFRQASVPPFYDLSKIDRNNVHYRDNYLNRFNFLKEFYQFAQARLNGEAALWSEWDMSSHRFMSPQRL